MGSPEPTCLVVGDCAALLPRLADAGWSTTADPARRHAVILLAGRCDTLAAARPVSAAPLLLVPPPGTSSAELVARLDALRRRPGGDAAPIRCGDLAIDPLRRSATRGGSTLALLPREYALLHHLAGTSGRAVSRMDLLRDVWRLPFDPGTNVVEVHVSRLRTKLDRGFPQPLLHTIRGRGYALAETPPLD